MSEREKLVKSTKRDLRSVLLAAKDGIPMQNLNSEFAKEVFSPIPHQRLGYGTLKDLLLDWPDVIEVRGNLCYGVTSQSTKHIAELVANQRVDKKRPSFGGFQRGFFNRPAVREFDVTRQRGLRAAGTRSLPWDDIEKCLNVVKEFRPGVLLEHFEAAYHKVNDRHLKYLQHGFVSLEDCLSSIPEHFEVRVSGLGGKTVRARDTWIQKWKAADDERKAKEQASKLTQRLEKLRTSASGSGQEKELVSMDSSSSCSSPRRNWSGSVLTDSDDEEDEFQDCLEFQTARDDQSSGPSSSPTSVLGDVVPDDVKSNLQALVKLYPTGLAVNDLKRVYAQHHKTDLDHRSYGCVSMVELCAHLKDVLDIRQDYDDTASGRRLTSYYLHAAGQMPSPQQDPVALGIIAYSKAKENVILLLRHLKANCKWTEGCPKDDLSRRYQSHHQKELSLEAMRVDSLEAFLDKCVRDEAVQLVGDNVCLSAKEEEDLARTLNPEDFSDCDGFFSSSDEEEQTAKVVGSKLPQPRCDIKESKDLWVRMIKQQDLSDKEIGSWIDVLVIDIYTPDKFYVRVDEFKSAFVRMENELQEFYNANASNRDLMPQNCPQEMSNLTCAVKADWGDNLSEGSNCNWRRGWVSCVRADGTASVWLYDWGYNTEVKSKDIRYLLTEFATACPAQALEARCAGIRPKPVHLVKPSKSLLMSPQKSGRGIDGDGISVVGVAPPSSSHFTTQTPTQSVEGKSWTQNAKSFFCDMVKENNFLDGEYHGFAACFKGIQRLNVEKLSLEMWETAPNDPKYENKKDKSINEEMIINGHAVKDEGMNDNIDAVKVVEAKYANLERSKPKEEVCKPSALWGALGLPLASAAVSKQPKFTLEDFERLSVPGYQMKRWN